MDTQLLQTIITFLESIGIPVHFGTCHNEALPGIMIDSGYLIIDTNTLLYPGDILHEAGHIAVMPPAERLAVKGTIDPVRDLELSGELMAIPWSYAACVHLGIDPHVVFHENGYKGGGGYIVENFSQGHYIGVPMLQYIGLCYDQRTAQIHNAKPFPVMIKWMRDE